MTFRRSFAVGISFALWAASAVPAAAQESSSYRIRESTFNVAGHPDDGVAPASASYRITLGSLGEPVAVVGLAGATLSGEGGFVGAFAPPGEVRGLRFADAVTLVWQADPAAGDYAVYQGIVTRPFDPAFGACLAVPTPGATATVPGVGAPGAALFYLVTARNRLGEEGPKGAGRANPAPCP